VLLSFSKLQTEHPIQRLLFLLFTGLVLITTACGPDGPDDNGPAVVDFDRKEMLTGWVNDVILPAHRDLATKNSVLVDQLTQFESSPDAANLTAARTAFNESYLVFQRLDPVLIGKAEENRMRVQLNTYPVDENLVKDNITDGSANLNLPSQIAAQGFPALEFLLYGADELLLSDANAPAYALRLAERITQLNEEVLDAWDDAATAAFIENDGNSATASIDRTVNDYIFYYEKFLRAGKVGIPAGVFSDDPLADRAESLYARNSKALLLESLEVTRSFFALYGLADYLDALDVRRDGELLSRTINDRFSIIKAEIDNVGNNFSEQVATDNTKMLALYDEMQKLVILLKVDMLQALSINVDYVDADGD